MATLTAQANPATTPSPSHHHKAPVPIRSSPAPPCALHTPAPPSRLDSQNNSQHRLPTRPPAEIHIHRDPRSDIRQSTYSELSKGPAPASDGSNELSLTEPDKLPTVAAIHTTTSLQA
ncbi:hypothetical protein N7468_004377 [Penicillium chermesinum]|uniref:Uncharacterized protein n=1 Tax=Penicillium chermesinum TaxID=63820 RepID=A0A9W9PAS9_9EURO|nr:uncharacterized protein N7468_004377 [Penicillium chermesinum]KAJ5239758.1 hypothetical protein N7468_004377 [Penicillium chermesinum]